MIKFKSTDIILLNLKKSSLGITDLVYPPKGGGFRCKISDDTGSITLRVRRLGDRISIVCVETKRERITVEGYSIDEIKDFIKENVKFLGGHNVSRVGQVAII